MSEVLYNIKLMEVDLLALRAWDKAHPDATLEERVLFVKALDWCRRLRDA